MIPGSILNRSEVINQMIEELRNWTDKSTLNSTWREMHGFTTAMASIEEMAEELAKQRGLIK